MPVLIIGTTDLDRDFHPFGISVCSNETEDDFTFIFKNLMKFDSMITIDTLVSDASIAIHNVFRKIFGGNSKLVLCWSHMDRNVVKKLHLVNKSDRNEIIDDIDKLQLSSNKEIFGKAMNPFI